MKFHEIKTDKKLYIEISKGKQDFITVNYSDKLKKGDILILQEHIRQKTRAADYAGYTGEAIKAEITKIVRGKKKMGLSKNLMIVSFYIINDE